MNYTPNTIDWQIGDLVIHDADHKSDDMIMRVTGRTRDGLIKTKYLGPDRRWKNKIWANPKEALHDPERFGITIPAWYRPPTAPASASEASPPATATPQAPGPVAAVYAKYKHIDRVFSMLPERDDGCPTIAGNPFYETLFHLWTAIKAQEAPHA
jgi:hypothetical protein